MSQEWIPDLPAAWRHTQIRHLARVFAGGTPDRKNPDYWVNGSNPWLNSGAVNQDRITEPSEFVTDFAASTGATRWVRKGSVVVALAGQGKTKGMAARTEMDATLNQSLAAIEPGSQLNYRFLHYWLKANYRNLRGLAGGDLRDGLNLDHIGSVHVPLPPVEEQSLIADYLDRETAEIDAFLADLENLKTLTTERVLALLEHELWGNADEVAPLRRFLLGVDQGISPEADSSPAGPGEVGVLKAGCTNNGRFDVWANKRLDSSDQFTASMFVAEGDLIVTRASGSLKHVGSAALVPCLDRKLAMSDKHYRLIPDHRLNGEYLALVMQTNRWRTQLEPLVSGAHGLARNISVANLKTLEIPVVSRAKQEETKANLREQIQKVGMASEDVDALISLGEERRAALISAAVTGQINVTEQGASAAEQLWDELEVHV